MNIVWGASVQFYLFPSPSGFASVPTVDGWPSPSLALVSKFPCTSCRSYLEMVLVKNSVKETYYDILLVQENASYEEIRTRYRSLILNHHPDKLYVGSEPPTVSTETLGDSFLKIQKAWEILSDARSRRLYNNELQALRQDMSASEDVFLNDMMIEDEEEAVSLYYPCRCGDCFSVDSNEFEEMGYPLSRDGVEISLKLPDVVSTSFIIPCGSCSLKIRLLVESDAVFSATTR